MPSRLFTALAYVFVVAAAFVFAFIAPWHSPFSLEPAVSDSYMLGFDNSLATAGVLASLAALLALGWRRRGADSDLVLAAAPPKRERVSAWLVALLLVLSVSTAVFFAWLTADQVDYGEKSYFVDRLAYVLGGWAPYRDIEFTYGPALIYLPALVTRLLGPLGVGPADAYSITWIATYAAGVPLLAWCVNRLALTRAQRNATFAAIGIAASFNESVGMNGLLLRFLVPVAALLVLHAAASRATGKRRLLVLAAASAGCGIAGVAVSPEVGITVLAGAAVYLVALSGTRRLETLPAVLGLAVPPSLAWLLFGGAQLRHMLGMAGGALNFPVLPGPPMLVLLAAALAAATLLPRHLGGAATAVALGLATVSAAMLVGALARADSSHAYLYGLPVALLAFATLARRSSRAFVAFALAYALVFLCAHVMMLREDYGPALVERGISRLKLSDRNVRKLADLLDVDTRFVGYMLLRELQYSRPDAASFERYAPLAAPFGFRNGLGFALAERGWLAPAYFRGTPFTPVQLKVQIASLGSARHLVVPDEYAEELTGKPRQAPPPEWLGGLRYLALLMWGQKFQVRHVPPDLSGQMTRWIAQHYRAVSTSGGYTVLERRTPSDSAR